MVSHAPHLDGCDAELIEAAAKAGIPATQLAGHDTLMPHFRLTGKQGTVVMTALGIEHMPTGDDEVSAAFTLCHRNGGARAARR